jgi:hypothetical protein
MPETFRDGKAAAMSSGSVVFLVAMLVFVGVLVAIAVAASSRRRRLKPQIATRKVRSTGTILVPLPPEVAAQAVRHALHLVGMREVPPTAGHLEALTNASMWSWGERVSVQLQPGPQGTAVSARSVPRLATTLVDYGKGQRNVELLLRKVHELVHARQG